MEELRKIDLEKEYAPVANKQPVPRQPIALRNNLPIPVKKSKRRTVILLISAFLMGFLIIGIGLSAQKTYSSALATYKQAKLAWSAIKNQDVELAAGELAKTKQELEKTQKNLQSFSYARFIPLVGIYYSDADHLIKAGLHGINAATIIIDAVAPYVDVLGLKGKGSFVMGPAEERIKTAVLTMGKITPRVDELTDTLILAQQEVDKVNPNRYPGIWGITKIKKQLTTLRESVDSAVAFADEARPLVKVLPSLLGESEEKKYLVLFQNDKELRPTGGFITAYGVFSADKGVIRAQDSSDIYNLDNSIRSKPKAPEPILKYLPNVNVWHLRDTNLSPDFVESMLVFNSLYKKAPGNVDVDGIIALDTQVLVSTIKILDDEVVAGGITFTSKNDSRCDCPQVIYELERLISTPKSLDLRVTSLVQVQAQRKDFLGVLLDAIMQKALKSSPKLYWGPLVQSFITQTHEKHILFYLYDKEAQRGVEALNAAGRIKLFEGDYLHINDANFGGAKSNLYVEQSVDQNIEASNDGVIKKTVTIKYKNPRSPSDCNLERGRLCLNAVLRDWVRVYVPKGSRLLDSKGSEVKVTSYEELNKTVFEGFLTVRPLGLATYTLTYQLPFKVKKNSHLPLLVQKQPGTNANQYTINVNEKKVEQFPLTTDRELKLQL